jgi:phage tail-like protein
VAILGDTMTEQNQNDRIQHELNYVTANRFYIEMESEIKASFTECQGLGFKLKREAYSEGGVNNQQRILVGAAEFTDVTLKRGITNDLTFLEWIGQVMPELIGAPTPGSKKQSTTPKLPKHTRRNVNILVFNQAGDVMQCWTLIGAVPIGWKAPFLQANATTAAIEELTLAYEGLKVTQPDSGKGTTFHTGVSDNEHLIRDKRGYFVSK